MPLTPVPIQPQSRDQWLALVSEDGRELRGKAEGEGGQIELYTNKRSPLGNAFAFIKDRVDSGNRMEQRVLGRQALSEFLANSSGLTRAEVQTVFGRAGINPGAKLTKDVIANAFRAVDAEVGKRQREGVGVEGRPRVAMGPVMPGGVAPAPARARPEGAPNPAVPLNPARVGVVPVPMAPPRDLNPQREGVGVEGRPHVAMDPVIPGGVAPAPVCDRPEGAPNSAVPLNPARVGVVLVPMVPPRGLNQQVDINRLSPDALNGMAEVEGRMTVTGLRELITSGQLDLGIPRPDHLLNVEPVAVAGANTHGLFKITSSAGTFVVKESRGPYMDGMYFYSRNNRTGIWQPPLAYQENERLQRIANSRFGTTEQIVAPAGVRLGFCMPRATFEYNMEGTVEVPGGRTRGQVQHQISVFPLAPGREMSKILEDETVSPQIKQNMARDFGRAMGAMHVEFSNRDAPRMQIGGQPGGLRTLIHGDFHPGNVFHDPATNTFTAIDLSGAVGNFEDYGDGAPTRRVVPGHDMLCDVKRTLMQGALGPGGYRQFQPDFLAGYCENPQIGGGPGGLQLTPDRIRELTRNSELNGLLS